MDYQRIRYSRRIAGISQVPTQTSAFIGPGDIVFGAAAWWGLRAYSKTTVGKRLIQLRRDSDNAVQDFFTMSSGSLDTGSILAFAAGANLFITTAYDQIGALHLSQSTAANQPQFVFDSFGNGRPCLRFGGPGVYLGLISTGTLTASTPLTFSLIAKRTANFTQAQAMMESASTFGPQISSTPNDWILGGLLVAAADNAFHAGQYVYNGASADLNVDGSSNATTASFSFNNETVAWGSTVLFLHGDMPEIGIWPLPFTSAQSANMSANQHNYWGF